MSEKLYIKARGNRRAVWHQVEESSIGVHTQKGVYKTKCGSRFFQTEVMSSSEGQGEQCNKCARPIITSMPDFVNTPSRLAGLYEWLRSGVLA